MGGDLTSCVTFPDILRQSCAVAREIRFGYQQGVSAGEHGRRAGAIRMRYDRPTMRRPRLLRSPIGL